MTHEYRASIHWTRGNAVFTDNRYSRGHFWRFDGGLEVPASSSPRSVPVPLSIESAVDPEEALVAAVASCHMLFFLGFAAEGGFAVDRYDDTAVGVMTKNEQDKRFISKVTLNPSVVFSGRKRPSDSEVEELHRRSHEECFIANSVKAAVVLGNPKFSVSEAR